MSGYTFPIVGDYSISSRPGARSSPGGIGSTWHNGIDIAAGAGTPVVAPIGGTVISAGTAGGFGNLVQIRGDDGNLFRFAHLQGFNVKQGMTVNAGQQIGRVGSTGKSTGNHLHYEIRNAAGKVLNPDKFISGALKQGKDALINAGKDLLGIGADDIANVIVPGSGAVLGALGIGGDSCGVICQIQNWIKDSGFFQRLALAVLAFIVLASAFYMMKSGVIEQVVSKAKGVVK